jgi:hypothetical protein
MQPDVGEAGVRSACAIASRFAEAERVAVAIDAGEGLAQFVEGFRAERTQRQLPAGTQDAPRFAANLVDIAPLHGEVRPPGGEARVPAGQRLDVGREAEVGIRARQSQHGRSEVDRGELGAGQRERSRRAP